jgi:hypothetical protein
MNYDEYAPLIQSGDLISVPVAHSIMGKLTQFFTRSEYTHSGVAFWMGNELFMAELNGGRNHLIPIIQLQDFDVYECPQNLRDVNGAIRKWLSYPVQYGYSAFIAIGLLNWFRIKAFVHWRNILVCSGYVVAIWETAGWPEHTRILSPGELAQCTPLKFKIRRPK